ncbi:unnamed protein product, partial [Amoebophrya sp. A25]
KGEEATKNGEEKASTASRDSVSRKGGDQTSDKKGQETRASAPHHEDSASKSDGDASREEEQKAAASEAKKDTPEAPTKENGLVDGEKKVKAESDTPDHASDDDAEKTEKDADPSKKEVKDEKNDQAKDHDTEAHDDTKTESSSDHDDASAYSQSTTGVCAAHSVYHYRRLLLIGICSFLILAALIVVTSALVTCLRLGLPKHNLAHIMPIAGIDPRDSISRNFMVAAARNKYNGDGDEEY